LSWKDFIFGLSVLAITVGGAWLEYAHGPELVRRLRFGATLRPEIRAVVAQAEANAKMAEAHAAEGERNLARAHEAALGARDAVEKARKHMPRYASQSPMTLRGETVFAYEGQISRNGSPEGLQVVMFDDGSRYEGGWKGGVPEGYGVMTYIGSRVHAGKWEQGVNAGDGVTVTRGVTWEGELLGSGELKSAYWGVLLCEASETCASRSGPFEIASGGEFNLNGPGIVTMRDGRRLTGTWQHGLRQGYGAVLDANGGMLEQGSYRNDLL
jgi:hypothetical protein